MYQDYFQIYVIFNSILCWTQAYIIIRKKHLDHLRHHLMPLYNFDPTEEGEDWEVELLEEGIDHQSVRRVSLISSLYFLSCVTTIASTTLLK